MHTNIVVVNCWELFSLRKGGVSISVIIAISLEFGEMGTNMNLIQVMSKWSWIYFFFGEDVCLCVWLLQNCEYLHQSASCVDWNAVIEYLTL